MNHSELTAERWQRFSLPQQLLQIAAELQRARSSFESGDDRYLRACYERTLRLIELTIEVQQHAPLRRELRCLRGYVAELSVAPVDPAGHVSALRALLRLHPVTNEHVALMDLET